MNSETDAATNQPRRFTGKQVAGIVAAAVLVTIIATAVVIKTWFFPSEFRPVALNEREAITLEQKIRQLGAGDRDTGSPSETGSEAPEAEPYSEDDARRDIAFTEKELNALLARNPDLARRLAVDLSDNLASARLLIPLDPDFPLLGGRIIRVSTGLELSYAERRPVVILRGVSIMGVPVPSAWLGNLKNVDLVREFGSDRGFWKTFAEGVELIEVRDGELHVRLKE